MCLWNFKSCGCHCSIDNYYITITCYRPIALLNIGLRDTHCKCIYQLNTDLSPYLKWLVHCSLVIPLNQFQSSRTLPISTECSMLNVECTEMSGGYGKKTVARQSEYDDRKDNYVYRPDAEDSDSDDEADAASVARSASSIAASTAKLGS